MCPTTKVSKYMKHKLTELQGNIVKPTITPGMVKDFNTSFSNWQNKYTENQYGYTELNTSTNLTLIEYTSLHTGEYSFFFFKCIWNINQDKAYGRKWKKSVNLKGLNSYKSYSLNKATLHQESITKWYPENSHLEIKIHLSNPFFQSQWKG